MKHICPHFYIANGGHSLLSKRDDGTYECSRCKAEFTKDQKEYLDRFLGFIPAGAVSNMQFIIENAKKRHFRDYDEVVPPKMYEVPNRKEQE